MSRKIVLITGPAASGKTQLGVDVAKVMDNPLLLDTEGRPEFLGGAFRSATQNPDRNIIITHLSNDPIEIVQIHKSLGDA